MNHPISLVVSILSFFFMTNSYAFYMTSTNFISGHILPNAQACEKYGAHRSPEISWKDAPKGTRSFLLLLEDPDARYTDQPLTRINAHWVLFIPATMDQLPEDITQYPNIEKKLYQTVNVAKQNSYKGPCPGDSRTHRYIFSLFALNQTINQLKQEGLNTNMIRDEVVQLVRNYILATSNLTGLYQQHQ